MITKTVLDAQTTFELPAREMLAFFNFAAIYSNQAAQNNNAQLNVIGVLQLNASGQSNAQGVAVSQS